MSKVLIAGIGGGKNKETGTYRVANYKIEDKVYKAISLQLAKGLLETGDLELVYVKSEPYEPDDLSIMCEYGMAKMFDKKNWLPNGNRLGKMLMNIREELKGKLEK